MCVLLLFRYVRSFVACSSGVFSIDLLIVFVILFLSCVMQLPSRRLGAVAGPGVRGDADLWGRYPRFRLYETVR